MPKDHYIPQVYLKKFYSKKLSNRLYALRKSDLKTFTPNTESICRIEEGNTNVYLNEDRAIEEFLKRIEPNYNKSVEKIISKNIDHECIYTISGLVAYIMTCSPTAIRLNSEPIKKAVEGGTKILEAHGKTLPSLQGKTTITELLNKGDLEIGINPKYPQALGIASILGHVATFGNFKWEILHNPFVNSPFFTSDYPVATEKTADFRVSNRIIPLTPKLALRIRPDILINRASIDDSFKNFTCKIRYLNHKEVVYINRLIVQCAENQIFYSEDQAWIPLFIEKHRNYRLEPHTEILRVPGGTLQLSTEKIGLTCAGYNIEI